MHLAMDGFVSNYLHLVSACVWVFVPVEHDWRTMVANGRQD